MNVWIVLAYDQYYPYGDNIRGIFDNEDSARELVDELVNSHSYDYVDLIVRGVQN